MSAVNYYVAGDEIRERPARAETTDEQIARLTAERDAAEKRVERLRAFAKKRAAETRALLASARGCEPAAGAWDEVLEALESASAE